MTIWDAVVIGAGPSGTLVAQTLAARDLRVCLIDGGPRVEAGSAPPEIDPDHWGFEVVGPSCDWVRVRAVGGASLAWGGWANRFPDAVFRGGAWPYSRDVLMPYYERVEAMLGVREQEIDARCVRAARELGLRAQPMQTATRRQAVWNALDLPFARHARANTTALRLSHDGERARELHTVDRAGRPDVIRARRFVMAASPIETARLLLSSRLGELAPRIGRGLVHHPVVGFFLVEPDGASPVQPDRAALIRCPDELTQSDRSDEGAGFTLEVTGPRPAAAFDQEIRAALGLSSTSRARLTTIHAIGEAMPHAGRFVDLSPGRHDGLGRRLPRIHLAWSQAERTLIPEMRAACLRLAQALSAGRGELVQYMDPFEAPMLFHEAGTCAMGRSRGASCDDRGRLRSLANVWVADASALPRAGDRHPTLTILAHALRAAESIAASLVPKGAHPHHRRGRTCPRELLRTV